MAPKLKDKARKTLVTPSPTIRDPSLPAFVLANPKTQPLKPLVDVTEEPWRRRFCRYIYNKNNKTICERTCKSWCTIIAYAIIYMIFLCTYMLVILYATLITMKHLRDYRSNENVELLTYSDNKIGLSVIPSTESYPLIWYKNNYESDYKKYVKAIDKLLLRKRRKRDNNVADLGPCGHTPYGYGSKPCMIIKMDSQITWRDRPLQINSSKAKEAPSEVQKWLHNDKRFWLTCGGHHPHDKEHIGTIKYYPDPPGFSLNTLPLGMQSSLPLVAVQISEFTLGITLAIQCRLWYENGPSSVEFLLYVAPGNKSSEIHARLVV